jgi:16S rRNA (cytosine1402-N4)-methyltransferase
LQKASLISVNPFRTWAFKELSLQYPHQPVLVGEVLQCLVSAPAGTYVDGTVGTGGHSEVIGKRIFPDGQLICLDRDPDAVSISKKRLAFLGDKVRVIKASYAALDEVLDDLECKLVNGVFLDLGMSSNQLERSGRGFSFTGNEPLDMRMDPGEALTAGELVNNASPGDLVKILREFGEERRAKSIVRAIHKARQKNSIETSSQLATLVKSVFPLARGSKRRHPATRTFQALRIAVNKELQNLQTFLNKVPLLIDKGGRLVILSYHSLEDRLVKQTMVNWENPCTCPPEFLYCVCGNVPVFRRLFKKGVKPSPTEVEGNPRARSAIMRAAERI